MQTDSDLQPLAVAKLFAALAKKEDPQLVLLGMHKVTVVLARRLGQIVGSSMICDTWSSGHP